MSGEINLSILLRSLRPKLQEESFVFACTEKSIDWSKIRPWGMFQEQEGTTLILDQHTADEHGFSYESIFSCITLQIHSSLHAVGLTAAVSQALAQQNIPANMIAAYHHDHIFIPQERAMDALMILTSLSQNN